MKRAMIFFLFVGFILLVLPFNNHANEEDVDSTAIKEEQKVDVRVTELRAQVSPQLEIILPTGNIYQHFVTYFNNLEMTFNLNFSVMGNTLGGDIRFTYPMNIISPYISFYQKLDFENYIAPAFDGKELTLVPTDKYIARERGFNVGLKYEILNNFYLVPSFVVNETFKGSLTENKVLEEGVELIPQISFVYDSVKAEDTDKEPIFSGIYYRTTFSIRYRNDFHTPVDAENKNLFLLHHNLKRVWFFEERVTLNYPIKLWEKELARFYSLGGIESIRGYEEYSIDSFRFFLLSANVSREILQDKELRVKLFKKTVRVHQYSLFLLFDSLFTQERYSIQSHVSCYSSLGVGIAFSLSGKEKTHFKIRLSAAQGLTRDFAPIIYFRTSLFSFERRL